MTEAVSPEEMYRHSTVDAHSALLWETQATSLDK